MTINMTMLTKKKKQTEKVWSQKTLLIQRLRRHTERQRVRKYRIEVKIKLSINMQKLLSIKYTVLYLQNAVVSKGGGYKYSR